MAQKALRRRYFAVWRIGEMESWLSSMSKKGLHLKWLSRSFAGFEHGIPEGFRYRLEFNASEADVFSGDQISLYKESGWEFVCEHARMGVFRSPESENVTEIYTDMVEQSYTIRKLQKKSMIYNLLIMVLYVIFLCVMWYFSIMDYPIMKLLEWRNYNVLLLLFIMFIGTCSVTHTAVSFRILIHSLRQGNPIRHNIEWKKAYVSGKIIFCCCLVIILVVQALPVIALIKTKEGTLPVENNDVSMIRLADIEREPDLERRAVFERSGVDWSNSELHIWSPLASTIIKVVESGRILGKYWEDVLSDDGIKQEYTCLLAYDLYRSEYLWIREKLCDELIRKYVLHRDIPLSDSSFYTGYEHLSISENDRIINLVACKGDSVVRIQYIGDKGQDAVMDAVRDLFSRLPD